MTIAALLVLCAAAALLTRRGRHVAPVVTVVQHRPRRRRARVAGAVVGVLVLASVGCTRSDTSEPAGARAGMSPVLDHAPLAWTDGLDHVVVYAAPPPARPAATMPDRGFAGESRAGSHRSADPPPGGAPDEDRDLLLRTLDGSSSRVTVPRQSLVAVAPADAVEAAAVRSAIAAGSAVALIVVDVGGVVGAAGTRYVMTSAELRELVRRSGPEAAAEDGASAAEDGASAADAPAAAGAADETDPAADPAHADGFIAALREVEGVVDVVERAPGVASVSTSGDRSAIQALDVVGRVEDDPLLTYADDSRQGEQWALANTGAPEQAGGWVGVPGADTRAPRAWEVSQGAGVLVAVIDSGVDLTHPDLASRLWTNPADSCGNALDDDGNGKVDDCRGWDFGADDANPNPDTAIAGSDHGTHVAGVIAASRDGDGVVGIAPSATIMPLKVANAAGAISTSAVYGAVVYAVDRGAQIVNISLATRPGTTRASVSALEQAVVYARSRGVLVVTGTGNDGVDITTRSRSVWPASFSLLFDNVIAVGATTNSDTRASFSNFGDPTTIWAPGWWMLSTVLGGGYGYKSGTSLAAGVVSGAAAAVIAAGTAATPSAIRAQLIGTAAITAAGYRVDVAAAVGIAPDPIIAVEYSGVGELAPDETSIVDVRVTATKMPAPVATIRLSLAAAVDYEVFAVEGVTARISAPDGSTSTVRSDASGAFTPIAVLDPEALATTGWVLSAELALPRGDYAFVAELLDADGLPLGGAQVAYVSVGGGMPVTSTTAAPTSTPTSVPGPASTVDPGAPTTADGAASSTSDAGPTTSEPETTTTVDDGASTTSAPGASTTDPAAATTDPGSTTTDRATTTDAPTTTAGSATTPPTSSTPPASSTSSTPSTAPPTTSGPTSTVAPTTTTGAPATTTPPPPGSSQGIYRIDSMTPRYAHVGGGTSVTITGAFPTSIPVYVWFEDKGIVEVQSDDGETLTFPSPAVLSPGVTDVSVKFTLDTTYDLTLVDAFTFGTAPGATTTAPGSPTTTLGGGTSTTILPVTTTSPGATTSTISPVSTTSPSSGPSTTAGGPTTAPTSPTASVRLRPQPAVGALASLSTATWPRPGCQAASCTADPL